MSASLSLDKLITSPRLSKAQVAAANFLVEQGDMRLAVHLENALKSTLLAFSDKAVSISCMQSAVSISDANPLPSVSTHVTKRFLCTDIQEHAFLSIENACVEAFVDVMLGTKDKPSPAVLNETELGVFAFFLLKVLASLKAESHLPLLANLQLEDLIPSQNPEDYRLKQGALYVLSELKVSLDETTYRAAFYMPYKAALAFGHQEKPRKKFFSSRVNHVVLPFITTLGQVPLTREDMMSLQSDDIIVLENPKLKLKEQGLSGSVVCQIGEDEVGTVFGNLLLTKSGHYGISITNVALIPTPSAKEPLMVKNSPDKTEDAAPEESGAEEKTVLAQSAALKSDDADTEEDKTVVEKKAAPEKSAVAEEKPAGKAMPASEAPPELLKNVKTPLCIELGRVSMTLLEIAQLKTGAIIELSRMPLESVDLTVSGKSVGKGELLDVEGELGVRIVSLNQ